MISNKAKRNIWLVLSLLSIAVVIDRVIRLIHHEIDWWNLCSAIIITACCAKFYLSYSKQAKEDNHSDNPVH